MLECVHRKWICSCPWWRGAHYKTRCHISQCISWHTLQKDRVWLPRNTTHNLKNTAVYFLPLPKYAFIQIYLLASRICIFSGCACCITKHHLLCCANEPAMQQWPGGKGWLRTTEAKHQCFPEIGRHSISLTSMRSGISFNPAISNGK